MIDRSLNYGRHLIADFLRDCPPTSCVVDLGAGYGEDLAIAKKYMPQGIFHAIECWPPNIEHLLAQNVSVHALNIEKDRLPFADQSVDIVIANQMLEHTKELFWIFHETSRVLRVGGTFIIGVPNLASLHNRLLLAFGQQPTQIKSASAHVRGFTKPDLLCFFGNCFPDGYRLIKFGGSNFYPLPPVAAAPMAKLFPSLAWGIFLMFVKTRPYDNQFLQFPKNNCLQTNFYLGE